MTSSEIRQQFLDFFKSKGHHIVPSAPIVVKNDPTLMFTNAGMNQFKDYFLGNQLAPYKRIADTQKCLRVSGKHNDLEEVGVDTYHHTMFEMLGNWSFGDYFKTEAIAWSWELLTEVYKLPKDRLYVSVFEGDPKEGIPASTIALEEWSKLIDDKDHIVYGNKKDNFWEMGDTGPCGPCSEIHVDMRPDEERALIPGHKLVNADHPQVIEIWNNVFIQYNRKKDGSLEELPAKHVDTGMGFERLVRVIQGKSSNYDSDVFTPTIELTEKITGLTYDFSDSKQAIAFRVLADHIRAISFTIADGQLPASNGAGYVIRRILRRAVRYYFSFLNYKQPLLHQLVPLIADQFANVFPELKKQEEFVKKVILEEENGFLRTLDGGLKKFNTYLDINTPTHSVVIDINENSKEHLRIKEQYKKDRAKNIVAGEFAFELHDTYGFPIDLTKLIATENNFSVDEVVFTKYLNEQKTRSRKDAETDKEDWINLSVDKATKFLGYNHDIVVTRITKYRKVSAKGKTQYQLVLEETPFYAESGGQVGDTGVLEIDNKKLIVTDTKKENDLIVHFVDELPEDLSGEVVAIINASRRRKITRHHSVTHLMQAAMREVLGTHVAQKGSLNTDENLRFDFSHFAKVTDEEIAQIEKIVNRKIRQNIPVIIKEMPKDEAMKLGAMALFGEKYGDTVRVVIMDENFSIELCGGTHVMNTGELNLFKIISESAVAAGVRRFEALAGCKAEAYIMAQLKQLNDIKLEFKNPKDLLGAIKNVQEKNGLLQKELDRMESAAVTLKREELFNDCLQQTTSGINFIGEKIAGLNKAESLKQLALDLVKVKEIPLVVLCAEMNGKVHVVVSIDESKGKEPNLNASNIIKTVISPLIQGNGGGNATLASAVGQDASRINEVILSIRNLIA